MGQLLGLGAVTLALLSPSGVLAAGPDASAVEAPAPPKGKMQIGASWDQPVWADTRARERVRGDRPEGASIHVAYAAPDRRWDRELRASLEAFEATAFPEGQAPRKTIVDEPPEAWMRQLELPDIPVRWNTQTVEYLRYFKDDPKGKRIIAAWLDRMGRYEARLRAILAEAGLPEDLVYVAMVESGFKPSASSAVGAAGMWQFMEQTGRVYGLGGDYWKDDRLDFERSSYAAAAYLSDLEARFGTWELALAAYNAGYGLVVQTIRRNNTNNFWALAEVENGLPRQTMNYVPKILAAAIVGHNREAFGLPPAGQPALELMEVEVPPGTRFEDLAKAIGSDEDLLEEINGAYLRGRVPPEGGPSRIRIPRSAHAAFQKLGGDFSGLSQPFATYTARLGDDLKSIAAAHGITEKQLRKLNGIHDSGEIVGGVVLVVPTPDSVDAGESPLPPIVAVPPLKVPAGKRLVFFRVTRSTASNAIAASFDVGWGEIVAWNDLDPQARLVDGQMLQVLVDEGFDAAAAGVKVLTPQTARHVIRGTAEHLEAVLEERELLRRGYTVKKGDSLERIAKKFGLSHGSLARINGVNRNHRYKAGDVIVVYVDKKHKKATTTAPKPKPTTLTTELDVAQSLAPQDREHDTELPKARPPSTPKTSRVPGRKYDD